VACVTFNVRLPCVDILVSQVLSYVQVHELLVFKFQQMLLGKRNEKG